MENQHPISNKWQKVLISARFIAALSRINTTTEEQEYIDAVSTISTGLGAININTTGTIQTGGTVTTTTEYPSGRPSLNSFFTASEGHNSLYSIELVPDQPRIDRLGRINEPSISARLAGMANARLDLAEAREPPTEYEMKEYIKKYHENKGIFPVDLKGKKANLPDMPRPVIKMIMAHNSVEQIRWVFTNKFESYTAMSLGRHPDRYLEAAPRTIWNMARINKKLFDEVFPERGGKGRHMNRRHKDRRMLRHAQVNIRQIQDFPDIAKILDRIGIRQHLKKVRIWMNNSYEASKLWFESSDATLNEWIGWIHEYWPEIEEVDVVGLEFPQGKDYRENPITKKIYFVSPKVYTMEQIAKADALPVLAERMIAGGRVKIRSYQWQRIEYAAGWKYEIIDHRGQTAEEFKYNPAEDDYLQI